MLMEKRTIENVVVTHDLRNDMVIREGGTPMKLARVCRGLMVAMRTMETEGHRATAWH